MRKEAICGRCGKPLRGSVPEDTTDIVCFVCDQQGAPIQYTIELRTYIGSDEERLAAMRKELRAAAKRLLKRAGTGAKVVIFSHDMFVGHEDILP